MQSTLRVRAEFVPKWSSVGASDASLRVAVHFRAGDVFRGSFGTNVNDSVDGRTVPLHHIKQAIEQVRSLAAMANMPVRIYILSELAFEDTIVANELLDAIW